MNTDQIQLTVGLINFIMDNHRMEIWGQLSIFDDHHLFINEDAIR